MRFLICLLTMFLLVQGCGRKTKTDEGKSLAEALQYLNSKNYEAAIPLLEGICSRYPDNFEYKAKLMHAYAGAGGFESLKLVKLAKFLEKNFVEAKDFEIKSILPTIKQALDPIPHLSSLEMKRIGQAIKIYQEIEPAFKTAKQYNNLKWGMLHAYRLATTLKRVLIDAQELAESKDLSQISKARKFIAKTFESIFADASWTYKLLKHSYPKFQKIMIKIDDMVFEANPTGRVYGDLITQVKIQFDNVIRDLEAEYPEYAERLKKIDIEKLFKDANKALNQSLEDGKLDAIQEYVNENRDDWKVIVDAFMVYNQKNNIFKIPKIEFPKLEMPEIEMPQIP